MKIKIRFRKNLTYPILLTLFTLIRKINVITIYKLTGFGNSILITYIMFLEEIVSGLILYIYTNKFYNYDKNSLNLKIVSKEQLKNFSVSNFKVFFLLFMIAYTDFVEFILQTFHIPLYSESRNLDIRLRNMLIVFSFVQCYCGLKLPIFKHQKFSVIIVGIICGMTIIIETAIEISFTIYGYGKFFRLLILILVYYFFNSFPDAIEKYLMEYCFLNPFKMVMYSGMFGLLITFIYGFILDYKLEDVIVLYENGKNKFIILIILLIIYFILSAVRNIYRVIVVNIYSPMSRTLIESLLDPIYIFYYYFDKDGHDFEINNKKSPYYFTAIFILSIIVFFFSFVYNELIILYCLNLDHDTHFEVSNRASKIEKILELQQDFPIDVPIDADDSGYFYRIPD